MKNRQFPVYVPMFLAIVVLIVLFSTSVCSAQEQIYTGRPIFKEGGDRCYYVWHEGSEWHVRWTSYGRILTFSGRVQAEEGKLEKLKKIDVEQERTVIRRGRGPVVVRDRFGRPRVVGGRPDVVITREQDHIEKEGDRKIVFHTLTNDDIDGFDFKVNEGVRILRFNLEIDGKSKAEEVEVGRNNAHPVRSPFEVRLH
jgi:hypothetical protein